MFGRASTRAWEIEGNRAAGDRWVDRASAAPALGPWSETWVCPATVGCTAWRSPSGHSHGRSRVRLTARLLDRVQVRERGPCPRFGAWDAGVGSGSISTVRSRARVQAT